MWRGNVFVWVLAGFPAYLLFVGRFTEYLSLATSGAIAPAATTTTNPATVTPTPNAK